MNRVVIFRLNKLMVFIITIEAGLPSRICAKRPKLTQNDKLRRVEVAAVNSRYDIEIWRKCIFIDEISFETGPKSQNRIRRFPGTRYDADNIQEVQTSGWRSVMCCACFSYAGVGPILRSQGNFTSEQYINYLETQVMPYAEQNFPDLDFYILHDNSRIHTSFQTMAYLVLRFGVDRVISHAPKSPDCNPIENLFGILSKEIYKNNLIYDNENELFAAIQNFWNRIDIEILENLANSMPNRYNEVLAKNGSATRY
jgi:hypothetical protein